MPKSAYALVARTRRGVKNTKPREYILGDGNGNIYSNGQYLVRLRGPADENGNPTYGPVSRAFGGHANFLEKPGRHVLVTPNHKGQPVITEPVWEDLQQAGIKANVIHPNTAYRQFSRFKDMQNFKAVIYNPDGMRVSIRELVYIDGRDGSLQIWLGTDESNHVDLEPSIPATTGYHCYALISFNQDLYAASSYPLQVTTSTPQASTTALDATDRQEALDAMATDAFPIQFFRLVNGQIGLGIGDPFDLDMRQIVNVPGVRNESITVPKLANDVLHIDTIDPVVTDDSDSGYHVRSVWFNQTSGDLFIATNVTVGTAVWDAVGSGGGSGTLTVEEEDGTPSVINVTTLQFDGGVVSDEGGGVAKVTIAGGTPQVYPTSAELNHRLSNVLVGSAVSTITGALGAPPGQNPPALNDAWENRFFMAAGSYTLKMVGVTSNNRGISHVYIDAVSQGTIDWYTSSEANTDLTLPITLTYDGDHVIKIIVDSKNGSSASPYYFLPLWGMTIS